MLYLFLAAAMRFRRIMYQPAAPMMASPPTMLPTQIPAMSPPLSPSFEPLEEPLLLEVVDVAVAVVEEAVSVVVVSLWQTDPLQEWKRSLSAAQSL